ncbi:YigZ family protein [archaeon]|nr:MAG: YigZ family protein [archaeon]
MFGSRVIFTLAKVAASTASTPYKVLNQLVCNVEVIKKSKFITQASYIKDEGAAFAFIEKISDPKATHNCWAFKTNSGYRMNDDGEPSGTAGKPILSAIESMQLINTVVVVTRYYGGIKLGTGGLVRAYRSVAENALLTVTLSNYVTTCAMTLSVPSNHTGLVYNLLDRVKQSAVTKGFDAASMTTSLLVDVKVEDIDEVKALVMDVTKGRAAIAIAANENGNGDVQ